MTEYQKMRRKYEVDAREPIEELHDVKNTVPGQQTGLYSDNEPKDVDQMTCTLNNPGESSQDDRG